MVMYEASVWNEPATCPVLHIGQDRARAMSRRNYAFLNGKHSTQCASSGKLESGWEEALIQLPSS